MSEVAIQNLPEEEALEQIVETVRQSEPGVAPFALVLGSGFSHGLVPTARQVVEESLPLWVKSLEGGDTFEQLSQHPQDDRLGLAQAFWKKFAERNIKRRLILPLNSLTGLPENYAEAYKAAFSPNYFGAVGEPAQARKFQRTLMRLEQTRLNASHFLLASLLGVQPRKTRGNSLFKARAAFSRLILTTNFDPFLQTALQAVNRLYFMSDTPELGVGDEILDDHTDAIHLVYLHGSIHRRSQAATDDDIKSLKEKNARTLAPVLKRRGVIVLGYSGWDDAVVEALAACDRFDHRLYWCGRETDPLAAGAFGPQVPDILRKPSANYVKIDGAGRFIAQLCNQLIHGLPRLLENPIGQLRELLDTIDLGELEQIKAVPAQQTSEPQLLNTTAATSAFVQAKQLAVDCLGQAERAFQSSSSAKRSLASARVARSLGKYDECLKLCNEALGLPSLEDSMEAEILSVRANALHLLGRHDETLADLTRIISLPGTPVELLAEGLNNRGVVLSQKGESDKALVDYTRVIEDLRGIATERIAKTLNNRGIVWGQKGETDKALADYTRVIAGMPEVPDEQVAWALSSRGVLYGQMGATDKALADFTRLIEELPDVTAEQITWALYNRGVAWGEKGDTDKQLADYTRLIEQLPGAPVQQVAWALNNRGLTWSQKGETDKALADYTRVIEQLPNPPVDQVAKALYNRGLTWDQKGETDKALADYTRVIEQLPNPPVDQVAKALNNRGVIWDQKGEGDKALADYTRIIEQLVEVPVEQLARAHNNRGWLQYTQKAYSAFLTDTEAALRNNPMLDCAAFNLGLSLLACGRDADALTAYRRAAETFPAQIEDLGLKDLAEARESWLTEERAKPVVELLRSLKK